MSNKKYLGVDIGGTAVKIGIVSDKGEILGELKEYQVNFDGYETPILKTVIKSCKLFIQEIKIKTSELSGIGVSATGGINTEEGRVDGAAGHIKNWLGSNIKADMEREFSLPTAVLNDANAAALGEAWIGAAKGATDAVVVTIGTGVGGGIVTASKILLGKKGFAGEIGHMTVNAYGEVCSCENKGCLEYYGSMSALVRNVKKRIENGEISGMDIASVNGKIIFDEVKKGNEAVKACVDEWLGYIIAGIVGLVHIFNPETVILGGGVSAQKELFVDRIRDEVLKRVMESFAKGLKIEAAELGNGAGLIGAVYYLMNEEREKKKC